jgi:transposase
VCAKCGSPLEKIGEEVTEQLDCVPASFVGRQHVRAKYACKEGCQETVATAPLPPQPVEKGLPGPGLLAHVVTSRFADHVQLYRQEGIAARQGVELSRSALSGWIDRAMELAEPVYKAMIEEVLARHLEDGDLDIDNNAVENLLRPIALGRDYAKHGIMLSRRWEYGRKSCCGLEIDSLACPERSA